MSDHRNRELSDRLVDLSADFALDMQEQGDQRELDQLDPDESARQAFEAVAAELDMAYAETDPVEMPAGLEERLFAAIPSPGAQHSQQSQPDLRLTSDQGDVAGSPQMQSPRAAWFPWLIAAASLTITAGVLLQPTPQAPQPAPELTVAEKRDALLQTHANDEDLLRYAWTPTGDPAVVGEVTGELIWDEANDEGYMTIGGLEVNDPTEFQYQLWIFDATRPLGELPQHGDAFGGLLTQRPIDGGVFDINDEGEVVIPIDPKLLVKQGVAFAVTIEPPGGVVVSDRSRVPLLAIPPQG